MTDKEQMNDEEKLNKVFKLLANAIDPETNKLSNNVIKKLYKSLINLKNYFIRGIENFLKNAGFWEKISFWLFIVSDVFYLLVAIIVGIVKALKIQPPAQVMSAIAILLIIVLLSLLLSMYFNICRNIKKSKGFIRREIHGLTNPDLLEQQEILVELQDIKPDILKEAEYRFNFFIEQKQVASQSASNFLPLLLVIFFLLFVYFGFSLQPLEKLFSHSEKG